MSVRLLSSALLLALPFGPAREEDPSGLFARTWVIGASMSAGFGLSCDLGDALTATLAGEHGPVHIDATELFFTNPRFLGGKQVEAALEGEPTLVVALDYLFWFGYGNTNLAGGPVASEDERLALLELGLEQLDELDCALVVGDFPDMRAAIGKMLVAEQVPEPATLERLSKRVREWADGRERTLVVPLAATVAALGQSGPVRIGRQEWPAGTRLLQRDDLHPTLEGLVGVAQGVGEELVRAGFARESELTCDLDRVRAGLGTCARPPPRVAPVR